MARKDELVNTGEQIVKQKRKGNNPLGINASFYTQPGDNAKYLGVSLKLMNLPDIDLHDVEAVRRRLGEFFEIYAEADTKPTVSGMAMSLGLTRQMLWAIRTDSPINGNGAMSTLPKNVADCIKKAYIIMEQLWENYMLNGKVNPVTGIFLGKNNFGYQDKTEYVVTPNVKQENDYNEDDIRKRYALPESANKN